MSVRHLLVTSCRLTNTRFAEILLYISGAIVAIFYFFLTQDRLAEYEREIRYLRSETETKKCCLVSRGYRCDRHSRSSE